MYVAVRYATCTGSTFVTNPSVIVIVVVKIIQVRKLKLLLLTSTSVRPGRARSIRLPTNKTCSSPFRLFLLSLLLPLNASPFPFLTKLFLARFPFSLLLLLLSLALLFFLALSFLLRRRVVSLGVNALLDKHLV